VVLLDQDGVSVKKIRNGELDMVYSVGMAGQKLVALHVLNSEDMPK